MGGVGLAVLGSSCGVGEFAALDLFKAHHVKYEVGELGQAVSRARPNTLPIMGRFGFSDCVGFRGLTCHAQVGHSPFQP